MGHWYDKESNSQHTIVGKNGKERDTTLADARKNNWAPSVTTVMDIQAKPALAIWLQNQVALAAYNNPSKDLPFELWRRQVISESKKFGEKAAKRGNEIHDAMEGYYKDVNSETHVVQELKYIEPGIRLIQERFPHYQWYAEKSFCHELGFGGRVDLWGHYPGEDRYVIIDFKTKDKTNIKDMVQYDEHRIQLAAYQVGLGLPEHTRRLNLFISVNEETPGLCHLVECDSFDKYWAWFQGLLNVWKIKNNYNSGWV